MQRNITLSADEELIREARAAAEAKGTTLNELIREYLRVVVGQRDRAAAADRLVELFRTHGGRSGGRRWTRDELYDERLGKR